MKLEGGNHFLPLIGPGGIEGTRNMGTAGNPLALLAYQLYKDPAHTDIWGSACVPGRIGCLVAVGPRGVVNIASGAAQTFTVFGRIYPSNFFNRTPQNGSYSDVVNVVVDW